MGGCRSVVVDEGEMPRFPLSDVLTSYMGGLLFVVEALCRFLLSTMLQYT